MSLQPGRLLTCLLLTCVCVCRGLDMIFDRTPDNRFCAQLLCDEDISQSDEHISYLIGLSIYNVTLTQPSVKLASVSLFEHGLYIDPFKFNVINGTGSISRSQGHLALSFQDVADCLQGTFLCQLDFVTVSGQPGTITESTISGNSGHCSQLEELLTARVDNLTIEVTALEGKVSQLSGEKLDLQARLENATQRIAELMNASIDKPQVPGSTCDKGMPSTTSRQEFLLWGRVPALCDTETDGGGWVVIQRRTKGDVNFTRNWADYKNGFGTPDTDFWIGLDVIHNLTSQDYSELRLEYVTGGTQYYGQYSNVSVASESGKYRISGTGFQGSAVDCLTGGNTNGAHNNMYFTTIDSDNDNGSGGSCAEWNKGGWWYNYCYLCNFNGLWGVNATEGMTVDFNDVYQYLSFTEMKLRRG